MPAKREPRRETAPPPWEWGGEHYTTENPDGILVLWSVVRGPTEESVVHRASLRGAHKVTPQISFDSNSLKPSKRRWKALTHEMLLALPANHRNAVVHWHHGRGDK